MGVTRKRDVVLTRSIVTIPQNRTYQTYVIIHCALHCKLKNITTNNYLCTVSDVVVDINVYFSSLITKLIA